MANGQDQRITEAGSIWYVQSDPGSNSEGFSDPFSGIDPEYSSGLISAYTRFCKSVKAAETMHRLRHIDLDTSRLTEGRKSLTTWRTDQDRKKLAQRLRNDDSYQKLVKAEEDLASRQFRRSLANFAKELRFNIGTFMNNGKTMEEVRRETSLLFQEQYELAYQAGRRASGLMKMMSKPPAVTQEEESWFRTAVREELAYWNAFLDEVEELEGDFETKSFSLEDRIEMYVDTVLFMYHSGRVAGFPKDVLIWWWPDKKKSGEMCPGCEYMVKMSPFTRDKLPTVPRAGDTPCLMRCVHKLIVRYAKPAEVEKRDKELPEKEVMIRELARFMGPKKKKYRGKGLAYNPWLGQSTWGNL